MQLQKEMVMDIDFQRVYTYGRHQDWTFALTHDNADNGVQKSLKQSCSVQFDLSFISWLFQWTSFTHSRIFGHCWQRGVCHIYPTIYLYPLLSPVVCQNFTFVKYLRKELRTEKLYDYLRQFMAQLRITSFTYDC